MTRPTILDLDLVVVPREATDEMLEPTGDSYSLSTLWDAILSASPYPTAWDDVRKYVEGLEADVKREANLATTYAIDCMDEQKRAEAAEARIAELEKEKHAALTMIAMLEKRLADAERVIEPFADGRAKITHANGCRYHGGHDCDCGKDDYLRAARAAMEGK